MKRLLLNILCALVTCYGFAQKVDLKKLERINQDQSLLSYLKIVDSSAVGIIRLDTGTLCGDWKLQRVEKHIICKEDVFDSIDISFRDDNICYMKFFTKDSSYVNDCRKVYDLKYRHAGKPQDGRYVQDSGKARVKFVSSSYTFRKTGHLRGYRAIRRGFITLTKYTCSNVIVKYELLLSPGTNMIKCTR